MYIYIYVCIYVNMRDRQTETEKERGLSWDVMWVSGRRCGTCSSSRSSRCTLNPAP